MNKKMLATTLLAATLASASRAVASMPPEFEHGCEAGEYSHVFHAVENKAIEIEEWEYKIYLTPERAVWSGQPGYFIENACVELECDFETGEEVWLFGKGDNSLIVTVDYCEVSVLAFNTGEFHNVFLPIVFGQ